MKKKKTTKKVTGETLVNFILDKSGSMETVRGSTISGFNEYVGTLKNDGNKYAFSLALFDTNLVKRHINMPIEDVPKLDSEIYAPGGGTALYDAVCLTIKDVEKTVKNNQKVLTIIMTDGEENSSREFSQTDLKDLITRLEKTGKWSFVFLGANQDSWLNAEKFGISKMNVANFVGSSAGVSRAMNTMACSTSAFGGTSASSTKNFFSQQDQSDMTNFGASASNKSSGMLSTSDGSIYGVDPDGKITKHFSDLGKKSWEKRKKDLLN